MTINYKGGDSRIAEISYRDEEEMELIERMVFFLNRIKGWELINATAGWAYCEVEDRAQYEDFKKDYKTAKKMISNCLKFGF